MKTKYMHVYHPKKIVQEYPPSLQEPQMMDPGTWMPSAAIPTNLATSPSSALSSSSGSSAMAAAAAAATLSSMVQDKLSKQIAQELMMRYRNMETPTSHGLSGATSTDLRESLDSEYLRDYYRQQKKLSDQLMIQEAMQLPNFAQTKYLSDMGYNWDKSFGVKSIADSKQTTVKKSKKKKSYGVM